MTLTGYTLRPSLRAALLTFLVHHNPFYLLSALCMLAGCYALNSGLAPRTGQLGKLLLLIGTLNVYELMLIGLGLYLIRVRGIIRDGRTLLLLEAVFLVDLAFIETEAGSTSFRIGLALNGCILALALFKGLILLRVLWGCVPSRLFALLTMELATLFLIPSVFTHFAHNGGVTAGHLYAAWWLIGALLAGYALVVRQSQAKTEDPLDSLRWGMLRLYALLPVASLVAHLSMLHWVYRIQFTGGDLSPLLLGMTVALGSIRREKEVRPLRVLMPLAAVALAFNSPPPARWIFQAHLVTPAVLTIVAAYVTCVCCFFLRRAVPLLGSAAAITLFVFFGPTLQQIWLAITWVWQRASLCIQRLLPQTAIEWGVAAIGAAFGFLALGTAVSLRKDVPPQPRTTPAPPPL